MVDVKVMSTRAKKKKSDECRGIKLVGLSATN